MQKVNGGEDVRAIEEALAAAKAVTDKPSLIVLRTIIAFPAPNKMNTGAAHGSALGNDEVRAVKEILGFDPDQTFEVSGEVLGHTRKALSRGAAAKAQWQKEFDAWAEREPENKALFDRLHGRKLPAGWTDGLPTWEVGASEATRKASSKVLAALGPVLPELWGGSADLAESNNTTIPDSMSFGPESIATETWKAHPYGRTLHFGVREHAMGAILNGIALHGPTRPYGGTFFVFTDYMRPSVRLAALMRLPVIYVWTHDSIGLGEDGPTHQPIEHLAAMRAIPDFNMVRPGDANETAHAWRAVIEQGCDDGKHQPCGLALTRQNLPVLEGTADAYEGVKRGGYVLVEAGNGAPEAVIIATGSELQLAVAARETLEAEGTPTRVVSMPCVEWFDAQDQSYRDSVIPKAVKARVAVEAGIAMPWYRFVGDAGEIVSIEHFGASADYATLFREFGLTAEAVVAAAQRAVAKSKG